MNSKPNSKSDYLGISVSVLCLFHCLALPLVAMSLPALQGLNGSEAFHWVLIGLIIAVGYHAFYLGSKKHGQQTPMIFGLAGIGVLILALVLADLFHLHEVETPLTFLGSITVIWAHWLNLKAGKKTLAGKAYTEPLS